jgi:hypothetical protein
MPRTAVVYQLRKDGSGGTLWVHKPHGCWRRIVFTQLADVIGRLGSATTFVLPGLRMVTQVIPGPEAGTPAAPRDGPANGPVQIAGP